MTENATYFMFKALSFSWYLNFYSDVLAMLESGMIFEEKCFSSYILLTDQASNLPDCLLVLEMLGNMCIAIICFLICEVMNFEINLSILIKPFSYMIKKSGQKLKHLKNKKNF